MEKEMLVLCENDYILENELDIVSSLFPQKFAVPLLCAILLKDWDFIWGVVTFGYIYVVLFR